MTNVSKSINMTAARGLSSKGGKDRDTVSVEPGSRLFSGSVSVSESHFLLF